MHVSVRPFWCPKAGHSKEEYEDALSHRREANLRSEALHFAIADGATESSFSDVWAQLLVKSSRRAPLNRNNVQKRIEQLGKRWEQRTAKPLPWYAERKRQQGSFAAFLGLSLEEKGTWSAFAVGDSCLFQVRNDSLMTCFPIERSDQFSSHQLLISSIYWKNEKIWERLSDFETIGSWQPGDVFFMMTDALAQWFLSRCEEGETPWKGNLFTYGDLPLFATDIDSMRASGEIRNDDVTLLIITIHRP